MYLQLTNSSKIVSQVIRGLFVIHNIILTPPDPAFFHNLKTRCNS